MRLFLIRVRDLLARRRFDRDHRNRWPIATSPAFTSFDADHAFHESYEAAQAATQMSSSDNPWRRQRHFVLRGLVDHALSVPGDFVECGCWRGLSAIQIAAAIRRSGTPHSFLIFDSFEGLSEFREEDKAGPSYVAERELEVRKTFVAGESIVRSNLEEFADFCEYYAGWIPARFEEMKDRRFSFVHVDVDLHDPTRDCLDFFWPRLAVGGVLLIDDYGHSSYPGSQIAVDTFRGSLAGGEAFFSVLAAGNAFLLKLR